MKQRIDPSTGREALLSIFRERSPLGPLRVMAARVGHIFKIPLPAFHPYIVFGPQAARQVYVTDRLKLRWRGPDPVTDLLRHGVLVVDGEEHDRYRKIMDPALSPGQLPAFTEMMIRQTGRVTSRWQDGEVRDMLVEGRKIALLIVMEALFSVDIWDDLPRLWKPILKAIEYISPGHWIIWRRFPRPGFARPLKVLDEYLDKIIAGRRLASPQKGDVVQQPDLLQHLIDAGLDDAVIRDQMLTMLIAGHDTSTALLAWTFTLLGQHPEIYTRLVRELDESLSLEKSGPQTRLMDSVIKEALRLYPPIHMSSRVAAEPLEFEGTLVQEGDRLACSIYLTHRDPASWDRPDVFAPDRFSSGRKHPPYAYIPFGGGPRACIGSAFGQAEARIVIAHLLQSFTFEFLRPEKIRTHMGATLEPRPGVRVRVSRRS